MARPLPPLNSVRAFEAASRHLSFSRAAEELGVTQDNAASRRVLVNAGFVPVGPADPADLDGEAGFRYQWREFRD